MAINVLWNSLVHGSWSASERPIWRQASRCVRSRSNNVHHGLWYTSILGNRNSRHQAIQMHRTSEIWPILESPHQQCSWLRGIQEWRFQITICEHGSTECQWKTNYRRHSSTPMATRSNSYITGNCRRIPITLPKASITIITKSISWIWKNIKIQRCPKWRPRWRYYLQRCKRIDNPNREVALSRGPAS